MSDDKTAMRDVIAKALNRDSDDQFWQDRIPDADAVMAAVNDFITARLNALVTLGGLLAHNETVFPVPEGKITVAAPAQMSASTADVAEGLFAVLVKNWRANSRKDPAA